MESYFLCIPLQVEINKIIDKRSSSVKPVQLYKVQHVPGKLNWKMEVEAVTASWVNNECPNLEPLLENPAIDLRKRFDCVHIYVLTEGKLRNRWRERVILGGILGSTPTSIQI